MTGEPFPDRFRRWYRMLPPAMRVLLTVNTVLYVAWLIVRGIGGRGAAGFVIEYLTLTPALPEALFRPWQLLTYAFLHVQPGLWGFIAFGFNMLWLYWLGREYEEFYGSHRLFGLYVMAAVGGGLLAVALGSVLPAVPIPVAGAMGAVLAVICCVATINPDRGIGLLIIGVVPMKWVAIGFLTISVLFALGAWPYVAVYLGGAATGYGFARAQLAGTDLAAWARGLFPPPGPYGSKSSRAAARSPEKKGVLARLDSWAARRSGPEPARTEAPAPRRAARSAPREAPAPPDVIDRILDKISEQGYDALTDEEKRTLYEASKKG